MPPLPPPGPGPQGGLPPPKLDLPHLDGLFGGGAPGGAEMMAGGMQGMPKAGGPPPGMMGGPNAVGAGIAQNMGKKQVNPEAQAINLITKSIVGLNQLADLLSATDEANSRAVRQMIRVLGEILKTAQHGQMPAQMPIL